ncbi:hypothetical protein [Hellea balneolensis]|nr:hypothetical protein [Hellea balneolensis]
MTKSSEMQKICLRGLLSPISLYIAAFNVLAILGYHMGIWPR